MDPDEGFPFLKASETLQAKICRRLKPVKLVLLAQRSEVFCNKVSSWKIPVHLFSWTWRTTSSRIGCIRVSYGRSYLWIEFSPLTKQKTAKNAEQLQIKDVELKPVPSSEKKTVFQTNSTESLHEG